MSGVDVEIMQRRIIRELRRAENRVGCFLHEVAILVMCVDVEKVHDVLRGMEAAGVVTSSNGRWVLSPTSA